MRATTTAVALALVLGCASTPSAPTQPQTATIAVAVEDFDPRCDEVADLSLDGEHKPAVDQMTVLEHEEATCPDVAVVAVERSRLLLDQADGHVRKGLQIRKQGDLSAARESLRRALEIYPKYYWVEKILQNMNSEESAISAEVEAERLRQRLAETNLYLAREAEQQGNLVQAMRRALQVVAAAPAHVQTRIEVVRYAQLLGLKFYSAGEFTRARDLWSAALSLDQSNQTLREYVAGVEDRLRTLSEIKSDQ